VSRQGVFDQACETSAPCLHKAVRAVAGKERTQDRGRKAVSVEWWRYACCREHAQPHGTPLCFTVSEDQHFVLNAMGGFDGFATGQHRRVAAERVRIGQESPVVRCAIRARLNEVDDAHVYYRLSMARS